MSPSINTQAPIRIRSVDTQELIRLWKAREQAAEVTVVNIEFRPGSRSEIADAPVSRDTVEVHTTVTAGGPLSSVETVLPVQVLFSSGSSTNAPGAPAPIPLDEGFDKGVKNERFQEQPDVLAVVSQCAQGIGVAAETNSQESPPSSPSIMIHDGNISTGSPDIGMRSSDHLEGKDVNGGRAINRESSLVSESVLQRGETGPVVKTEEGQAEEQHNDSSLQASISSAEPNVCKANSVMHEDGAGTASSESLALNDADVAYVDDAEKRSIHGLKRVFARTFRKRRELRSSKEKAALSLKAHANGIVVSAESADMAGRSPDVQHGPNAGASPARASTKPDKLKKRKAKKLANSTTQGNVPEIAQQSSRRDLFLGDSTSPHSDGTAIPTIFLTSPDGLVTFCFPECRLSLEQMDPVATLSPGSSYSLKGKPAATVRKLSSECSDRPNERGLFVGRSGTSSVASPVSRTSHDWRFVSKVLATWHFRKSSKSTK